MNKCKWKLTGRVTSEGEVDLIWLVRWLLRIAAVVLTVLAALVAERKIDIHLW